MFEHVLAIDLRLSAGGKEHQLQGGWIKGCTLALEPHGFSGEVRLWRDPADDALLEPMLDSGLLELQLTLAPARTDRKYVPIQLRGFVTERAVSESVLGQNGAVAVREYALSFVDAATLFWRQHYPLLLHADAKVAELVQAQCVAGMRVAVDLEDATTERPLVCIPTGDGPASFYDFVMWYAEATGGAFAHDYWARQAHSYLLAAARPSHKSAALLEVRDEPRFTLRCPAPPRHLPRLVNVHSEAESALTKVAFDPAVDGVVRDRRVRTPQKAEVDAHERTETRRWRAPRPELELELSAYPAIPLMPGAEVELDAAQFGDRRWASGKKFRVVSLALSAEATGGAFDGHDGTSRAYHTTLRLRWESADDERARLPAFVPPEWPLLAEGKVLSDRGEPGDRTADPVEAEGLSFYEVFVPAWNQTVRVPFGPSFLPGHFFAPAYKGQRVLLQLYFDHAEIAQFLDWGPDVRLPPASEGNHLLFGKNQSSQTSLKHLYVDGKPVLSIERSADADRGRLQLEDGNLLLEVKEDTTASSTSETHDLVLEQELARSEVQGKSDESIGKMKAGAEASGRALGGKLDAMRAQLQGSIDGVQQKLSGQVEAARGELSAPQEQLDDAQAELRAHVQAKLAELRAKGSGS